MTQGNRTPVKQHQRVGQTSSAPKVIRPEYTDVVEDDRIDWERKQKGKKVIEAIETDDLLTDDSVVEAVIQPQKAKKQHKKKNREIIYDEELDQTIVKRKRRRESVHFHADLDDFE